MADLDIDSGISVISTEEATTLLGHIQGKVFNQLSQRGFSQPPQPTVQVPGGTQPYNGYIPPDLVKLSDDELGYYLGMLSTWLDYVQVQLAEAHMNYITAEKRLEFVEAKLYMLHKTDKEGGKKRTEHERKSLVITDRRYVEAQAEAIYSETYHRYVKAIATGAEQNYAAVSRRISQRQQDIERGKRGTNVSNIPSGPFFGR
jgi:hypothetical protein